LVRMAEQLAAKYALAFDEIALLAAGLTPPIGSPVVNVTAPGELAQAPRRYSPKEQRFVRFVIDLSYPVETLPRSLKKKCPWLRRRRSGHVVCDRMSFRLDSMWKCLRPSERG